jgi:hypothetical protein
VGKAVPRVSRAALALPETLKPRAIGRSPPVRRKPVARVRLAPRDFSRSAEGGGPAHHSTGGFVHVASGAGKRSPEAAEQRPHRGIDQNTAPAALPSRRARGGMPTLLLVEDGARACPGWGLHYRSAEFHHAQHCRQRAAARRCAAFRSGAGEMSVLILARDLYDSIGQLPAGLSLALEVAASGADLPVAPRAWLATAERVAGARVVSVVFARLDGYATAVAEDDGRGFDSEGCRESGLDCSPRGSGRISWGGARARIESGLGHSHPLSNTSPPRAQG